MKEVRLFLKKTINLGNFENITVDFGGVDDVKKGETVEGVRIRMLEEIEPQFDVICNRMKDKHTNTKKGTFFDSDEIPKEFSFGVPRKNKGSEKED